MARRCCKECEGDGIVCGGASPVQCESCGGTGHPACVCCGETCREDDDRYCSDRCKAEDEACAAEARADQRRDDRLTGDF